MCHVGIGIVDACTEVRACGYGIYLHLQYKDGKYKDELMMMVHPQLLVDCGIDEYVKELVEELNEELYDYLKHR